MIKVDPSREIRYVSIKHSNGTNIKGLRLLDEDEEYIVNKTWYARSEYFTDMGVWSTMKEIPIDMEICGVRTNVSSNSNSLGIAFIIRKRVQPEKANKGSSDEQFKQPEHGWLDIEMRAAVSETLQQHLSFHVICLSSSRISSLKGHMAKFIGRVENLTFHDKNPCDTHETVLRRMLTSHFEHS